MITVHPMQSLGLHLVGTTLAGTPLPRAMPHKCAVHRRVVRVRPHAAARAWEADFEKEEWLKERRRVCWSFFTVVEVVVGACIVTDVLLRTPSLYTHNLLHTTVGVRAQQLAQPSQPLAVCAPCTQHVELHCAACSVEACIAHDHPHVAHLCIRHGANGT